MIRFQKKWQRVLLLSGMMLLTAGCTTLPEGEPPAGAVTRNPDGTQALSRQEAVNRIVTEITVWQLSTGLPRFSEIQTEGEPAELLLATARKLSAADAGITGPGGPVLLLSGKQDGSQVTVTVKTGKRVYGCCRFQLLPTAR